MKKVLRILMVADADLILLLIGFCLITVIYRWQNATPNIVPYIIYAAMIVVSGLALISVLIVKDKKKFQ